MKKVFFVLMLLQSFLFASSGEEVFQKNCISCHSMDTTMQKSEMKGPPIQFVYKRLTMLMDREEFVPFVEDYIQRPSEEKGYCTDGAFKRFGVMPAVKSMSKEDRVAVAEWLFDNFKSNETCYMASARSQENCNENRCCKVNK